MTTDATLSPLREEDLDRVERLLGANGLPTSGVREQSGNFLVLSSADELLGTVGLEPSGRVALLRSLCVAEAYRGRGFARSLCHAIEELALTLGVEQLYLLTTSAPKFFERAGFAEVPRADAPFEIRATEQFQTLCPASAQCMHKGLSTSPLSAARAGS